MFHPHHPQAGGLAGRGPTSLLDPLHLAANFGGLANSNLGPTYDHQLGGGNGAPMLSAHPYAPWMPPILQHPRAPASLPPANVRFDFQSFQAPVMPSGPDSADPASGPSASFAPPGAMLPLDIKEDELN